MTEKSQAVATAVQQSFMPNTFAECQTFAVEASKSFLIPKHFRGQAGSCLLVTLQAREWRMSPLAVMTKTHIINEQLGYEAQLVIAVINTVAPIEGRLNYEYFGDQNNLSCKVTGKLKNDPDPRSITVDSSTQTTKNSPLWKTNPRQQLAYLGAKMWARLHCPEVMLGVYTPDELEDAAQHHGPENAVPVNDAPPRPQRQDFGRPEVIEAETIPVEEEKPHGPIQYCIVNIDGEIAQTDDPSDAANLMLEAIGQAEDRARDKGIEGILESNAAVLTALKSAGHTEHFERVTKHAESRLRVIRQPPVTARANEAFWRRDSLSINPNGKSGDRPNWAKWRGWMIEAIAETQSREELSRLQMDNEKNLNALRLSNPDWFQEIMGIFGTRARTE